MPDQPPVHVQLTPPEPGFTIGLREVYDELRSVSQKIDTMHDLPADVRELERQLRIVQDNYVPKASVRWWFSAVVGLVVAATTILALFIQQR